MEKRKWTNEEVVAYRKKTGAFFYFNKEDTNLLVPKASGFGRTFNFANPISWVIIAAVIGFIIWNAVNN